MEKQTYDVRLKHDSSLVVCGPSGSGKTEFVKRLLSHRNEMFDIPPRRIVWFYGTYQQSLNQFLQEIGAIMNRGLPTDLESFLQPNDLVVFDDLQSEMRNSDTITNVYTRLAHHLPCFAIFLVQHLFYKGKDATTRSLSTTYLAVMKSIRSNQQLAILASQMYPKRSRFLTNAYAAATREPFSYVFIDLRAETPDQIRIRANIFLDDAYQSVYLPNNV